MRTQNIKVKITMPIPFDRPDLNGVTYSKEAIERMTQQMHINNPIVFRTNEDDNPKIIGHTTGNFQEIDFDYENGICELTIDGIIYCGGIDIFVNELHRDKSGVIVVDDFRIADIGLSLPGLKLTTPNYMKDFYEITSEEFEDLKKCILEELQEENKDD